MEEVAAVGMQRLPQGCHLARAPWCPAPVCRGGEHQRFGGAWGWYMAGKHMLLL